ncbi:hypothetical protein DOTSEDRAFT_46138 [Dothistroma septosporum NZE10]|uniref:DUF7702 domain-containing protein n=1 Tax=Dothistroma septosporum (strain NZE10 / CBS 128990) TaxID=675120 RepID=N1PJT5_DOTSN|nr:hypothetical protein DOTSEDRAFT_46138 [Dothistroma septosporum NZE10]
MNLFGSRGDLAIAEVAFCSPASVVAIAICIKQGLSRSSGWLYLCLLSIVRLVGASCILYTDFQDHYSVGLIETAAITSSIGTAPLALALFGVLKEIHAAMS